MWYGIFRTYICRQVVFRPIVYNLGFAACCLSVNLIGEESSFLPKTDKPRKGKMHDPVINIFCIRAPRRAGV